MRFVYKSFRMEGKSQESILYQSEDDGSNIKMIHGDSPLIKKRSEIQTVDVFLELSVEEDPEAFQESLDAMKSIERYIRRHWDWKGSCKCRSNESGISNVC